METAIEISILVRILIDIQWKFSLLKTKEQQTYLNDYEQKQ